METVTFCGIAAGVNIPASVAHSRVCEGDCALHTFRVTWKGEDAREAAPMLTLEWSRPIVDIQYLWHSGCGTNRSMQPDWCAPIRSKISSGCPLHCFYNDAGQNRYTVALDDCLTGIDRNLGVHEEDATLLCRVAIPLDPTGETEEYTVTLRLDETDCRYEEAIARTVAWWEEKHPPMAVPAAARLPMYSFWYSFHQEVYADEVEAECARAAAMGMKTVIVDDGWQTDDNSRGYAYCGDWQPTPGKIPDMKAHVAAVHAMGLKYMLWYSVPFVGIYSEAARRFAGKTLELVDHLRAYTLDPRYPDVREYLIGVYTRALREWDLDGFKLDFIDSFNMRPDTPGFREGMDYVNLEQAVHRLMVDVMEALRAIKPDILIEFRQSYMGPAIREFGNMLRVGDCPNTTSTNRIGMVDLRLTSGGTAVHSDMLVWNADDRVENAVCQIENILFSVAQISVRLDRVPEAHRRAIAFWVKFMEEEQALLLDAPLRAESPQLLYPQVRTEQDGRSIIAVYAPGQAVDFPADRLRDAWVVNACSSDSLVLDFAVPGTWNLSVLDCTGLPVREETLSAAGLVRIPVPASGLIRLVKA